MSHLLSKDAVPNCILTSGFLDPAYKYGRVAARPADI